MYIVYHSLTGNTERFLQKVSYDKLLKLETGQEIVDYKFILSTYTTKSGEVPSIISLFMNNNHNNCIGMLGNGNKNWGSNYCKAVDILSNLYNIPILLKYEMSGTYEDVINFNRLLRNINV